LLRRLKFITVIAAIAAWFFGNAWRGLTESFSGDDMMNLYHAWDFPLRHLIVANLTPFNRVYRPAGAVFYRGLYDIFGLHPMPFRIAIYGLLLLNIALIYWLAKLLSGSTEIGILAALLGAYHNRALDIYVSGGTVYDVLCFSFYVAAVCVYIRARQAGEFMGWRSSALFLALNVLALNSKEMGATLPVVLLAYELLYHVYDNGRKAEMTLGSVGLAARATNIGGPSDRLSERGAPTLTGGAGGLAARATRVALKSWALWISFAMTIAVTKIRTGAGVAFSGNPDYAMHVTAHQFFLTTRQLLDDLFVLPPGSINTTTAVLVFAMVWAIAIWGFAKDRWRRDLVLCAVIITVTPLPINFISYRGFFVMYLPLIGWAMFIAISAVAGRDWLLDRVWHRPALPPGAWEPERVGLFLVTLYVLFNIHSHDQQRSFLIADGPRTRIHAMTESLARMNLPVPRGGSVLFVSDAFRAYDRYMPLYVVRLFYHDSDLAVDLEPGDRKYDRKLELCDQGYCEVKR
jgi:hypothetical protein